MSRRKRGRKSYEIIPPETRRVEEPEFRGSTIDYMNPKCQAIKIDENVNIKQFVDTYSAEVTSRYVADTRVFRPFVIENRVIVVQSASMDLERIAGEKPDFMLVFRNCALVNYAGPISLTVSGGGIAFEDCTFFSAGNVTMTLGAGTYAVFARNGINGRTLHVRGIGDTAVSFRECRKMTDVRLKHVCRIDISGELPGSVAVDTAEEVSIKGITEPPSVSSIPLNRITKEIYLEHCNFGRKLSIDKSQCSVRLLDSALDVLEIRHSVIDEFIVNSSGLRMLVGYSSVMMGSVTNDHGEPEITYVAATNCLGFPEVPLTMYKKVNMRVHSLNPFSDKRTTREVILRLSVPGNASKHYSFSYQGKFRVSEAKVEEVLDLEGNLIALPKYRKYDLESLRDHDFLYEVGKTAYPEEPFDTSDDACASGIHGYAELKKAAEYS